MKKSKNTTKPKQKLTLDAEILADLDPSDADTDAINGGGRTYTCAAGCGSSIRI